MTSSLSSQPKPDFSPAAERQSLGKPGSPECPVLPGEAAAAPQAVGQHPRAPQPHRDGSGVCRSGAEQQSQQGAWKVPRCSGCSATGSATSAWVLPIKLQVAKKNCKATVRATLKRNQTTKL